VLKYRKLKEVVWIGTGIFLVAISVRQPRSKTLKTSTLHYTNHRSEITTQQCNVQGAAGKIP